MNRIARFASLLCLPIALGAGPRLASAQPANALSEQAAVARAVANNPNLHVALLQASQADVEVQAEEGLYSAVARASAGITHTRQPRLTTTGDVAVGELDTIDVGAGVVKPFAFGTVIDLSIGGERAVPPGPTYSLYGRLGVTQPLLRGAGTELGLASLRQARLRRKIAGSTADVTASALLSDVLRAYWELWYADQVIRINEASRELAREQARQAEIQVKSGALAEIDALIYQTRRAELDEAVVLSITDRRQRSLALGLLLADEGGATTQLATADTLPELVPGTLDAQVLLTEAERASPELARLSAQIELAREVVRVAGDPLRPRLDLDAYVQVQGLGNGEVPPAFEQTGRFDAVSAHVGITFESPIDGTRRRAQITSARLSEHIARRQREGLRQSLRAEVLSALSARESSAQRVAVATETVRVATAQAEAERRRFTAGISIALQVQEAENSLRQAQLRLERARVDWTLSELTLLDLRGRLLERYRGVVARLSPRPPSLEGLGRSPL